MFKEAKMKKVIKSNYGATMDPRLKNGKLFISTNLMQLLLKALAKSSVSTSTDHSTLYLNFH